MKILKLLFLTMPLLAAFAACSDDNEMPQVDISLTYRNAKVVNEAVYVVKPDTLFVDSVSVTAVRQGHIAGVFGPVNYYLDGVFVGSNPIIPNGMGILTEKLDPGTYSLGLSMNVAEEGCELATALVSVKMVVVSDPSEIPSSAGGDVNEQIVDHKFK